VCNEISRAGESPEKVDESAVRIGEHQRHIRGEVGGDAWATASPVDVSQLYSLCYM
jgi:hypothetical protein